MVVAVQYVSAEQDSSPGGTQGTTHNGGSHLNSEYATIVFQREKPTFTLAIWAASVAMHPPAGQFGCRREYQHLHRILL